MGDADSDDPPYRVVDADGRFGIENRNGRVILVCGDRGSAEHYASLMIDAYREGYRQGRRNAGT